MKIFYEGKPVEVNEGLNGFEAAKLLDSENKNKDIAFSRDGKIVDMREEIQQGEHIEFIRPGSEAAFEILNHSTSHLMAQAIIHLYPNAKFGFGPAIEEGYYYDVDFGEETLTEADFAKIEAEMKKLSKANLPYKRSEINAAEAREIFKDNPYKMELIKEHENEALSMYQQGDFIDFCRGPHLPSTGLIKHFKLLSLAGAYWRGNSENKQLTRIYGTSWWSQEDLDKYLAVLEDRKERDHRRLGKQLGIFMFDDLVGRGLPMWLPNGFTVRRLLSDYIMDKEIALGYQHVLTPCLGNVELYKTSGHWDHYKDDMFPKMDVDNESYVLRPMNCPHHMVMYRSSLHSYRELPLRIAEVAADFRYEASGALTGIERTRAFYQNDSHIFCMPSQIGDVFKEVAKLILDVYEDFGFKDYKFRLSLRDPKDVKKYFGNDELWERSERELREVLKELGVEYYEAIGEAAFYGPKLDVQVRSAIGHDVTLSTIQLDYQLPERFELTYIDEKGQKARPVVIHRAILGSLDRFVAFLLEETRGVLPTWLAPTQVCLIPVNLEAHKGYCDKLARELRRKGIRVKIDVREEKLGYKIREAQVTKIPYQLVVGDKEVSSDEVTYRRYGEKDQVTLKSADFIAKIVEEVERKAH
ncbi:MAG: threonine--tRNA ligase [Bacilli bacterium]|nr:threonine--tRNA ligase [Bacilli bacterium]